jgi:hypothetical protein
MRSQQHGERSSTQNRPHILVIEMSHQLNLPQNAFGVRQVVESVGDFLDGDLFPG